jgi:S-adenosylmethionine:tRNA ribosyltransferase-isomerase
LLVSEFDYTLPQELIAQEPPSERGASRMLVVSREDSTLKDDQFDNFHTYLRPEDCLVINDTRVFPARLYGRKTRPPGARIEVFLIRAGGPGENVWDALVRPAKRLRQGDMIVFDDTLWAEVLNARDFGERTLRFYSKEPLQTVFDRLGSVPLPPYIRRSPAEYDRERYQTVFAQSWGSVAAPTAGLHFTNQMLDLCRTRGAEIARLTLHVGLGTFAPLREKEISQIRLHEEYFEIAETEAAKMRDANRLICVGTTSVRTVETAILRGGFREMRGETNLFISPGFHFRATGAMLTNFHLPQSSLLILVCAFGGRNRILNAYQHAVAERYRFYSYGDCMLIL